MDQERILQAAAEAAKQVQEQPSMVAPQPVPMTVQMSTSQMADGSRFVVLIVHHPMGSSLFHFDPNGAEAVADGLKDAARIARTGLEIAR